MKKNMIIIACAVFLLTSCDTYTGMGAYTGASLGSVLGSAIGGIAGGPHGSDVGTLVGLAGGAAVGASVGSAADAKAEQKRQDTAYRYQSDRRTTRASKKVKSKSEQEETYEQEDNVTYEYGGSQEGDDRIYDMGIPGPEE